MTDDLFGERPDETAKGDRTPPQLADWLVSQVRRALDGTGATEVAARQHIIESLLGRPVSSLRELAPGEAREVVEALVATTRQSRGSSWDERDEATWIDRL